MGAKTLIVGDIHGCIDELHELIERAGLSSDDRIVAVGDIVDRGPAPLEVLRFFGENEHAVSLNGNHERKHLRSFRGLTEAHMSQHITRAQIGEESYPSAIEQMDRMPTVLELPEAIVIHGFFEPGVPLAEQDERYSCGVMSAEMWLKGDGLWPWYEHYDGDKPLVVGHLNYSGTDQPMVFDDKVFMLDTGCCRGGALSGLVLPGFKLVRVPSRADHWSEVRRAYRDLVPRTIHRVGPEGPTWREVENHLTESSSLDGLEWPVAEMIVPAAAEQEMLDPAVEARCDELAALLRLGEAALRALADHVETTAADAVRGIRESGVVLADLTPGEQYVLFKEPFGPHPLVKFLHQARKGEFRPAGLKIQFRTPSAMVEMASRLGLDTEKGGDQS